MVRTLLQLMHTLDNIPEEVRVPRGSQKRSQYLDFHVNIAVFLS